MRLGLDLAHLDNPGESSSGSADIRPDLRYLRHAAPSIAASWFSLCGFNVAIPVEPTVYDLLVSMPEGIKRIQVKTTTCFGKDGWTVAVGRRPYSIGNREGRIPYDPELIDWFFIMDGHLNIYLIPSRVIAGRIGLLLRAYTGYIVATPRGSWFRRRVPRRVDTAGQWRAKRAPWGAAPSASGVDCGHAC